VSRGGPRATCASPVATPPRYHASQAEALDTWGGGSNPVSRSRPSLAAENAVPQTVGLDVVAEKTKGDHAVLGGEHWERSPLIEQLASEGKTFQELGP